MSSPLDSSADISNNNNNNINNEDVSLISMDTRLVDVRPMAIYGLRTDVIGNVHYTYNQEVAYPVEGSLACHDFVNNKQRFIRFEDETFPLMIQINHTRRVLAILEQSPRGRMIGLYDIVANKKRRELELPPHAQNALILQILFMPDSRSLLVLTRSPYEGIFLLMFDRLCTVHDIYPNQDTNARGAIECIACNQYDPTCVAVGGNKFLVILTHTEEGFVISTTIDCPHHIMSMVFLAFDLLLVGSVKSELILVDNGEFKFILKAEVCKVLDLLMTQEALNRAIDHVGLFSSPPEKLQDNRIVCLSTFNRGFIYAIYNKVFVFERVSKYRFERKTTLTIPVTIYAARAYQINHISVDPKQETVIVTAKHSQIYVGILIVPETLRTKHLKFTPMGPNMHIAEIVDMSICSWKPIIMTASKDKTVRIWNYETSAIELVRKFQVGVNLVALNNTGLLAAIAFPDQLRFAQIFMEDLNIVKTYNLPRCKKIAYSNYGHFLAAAVDNTITILSVYNMEMLRVLRGHNNAVLSIYWSKTDKYLFSGGAEGAIYQWDVDTGGRVLEIVEKGVKYISICSTMNSRPMSIYGLTEGGVVREFRQAELFREVTIHTRNNSKVTDLCLARSDLIMFASNDIGDFYSIQLPFLQMNGGTVSCFRFFTSGINRIKFSYDGTLFVAAAKSGTLGIWALQNIKGKVAPIDADLLRSKEVLIPRKALLDLNDQIHSLELRLRQQAEEFEYQLSQNEIFDGQQLAEVHKGYCSALEELKRMNTEIEERHTEDMNQITFQIDDLKVQHKKQLNILAIQYSDRMLIEYQKFTQLRESMLELRELYEAKLKKAAGTLQDTIESLEGDYKFQLDDRRELIRQLLKEVQDKKLEFVTYCNQVEADHDRQIITMRIGYERRLIGVRNETLAWRGETGIAQKRYLTLKKDVNNLLEEVDLLKDDRGKTERDIFRLHRVIEDLQRDILDREYVINTKERRIQDLLHKNQELDKYKHVLSFKIAQLTRQIEPREFQLNDTRRHVLEMEKEMRGLNQDIADMQLQLKEMKTKYANLTGELNLERYRARAGRECLQNIYKDIYDVASVIDSAPKLRAAVRDLIYNHSRNTELKRFVSLDANVRDEFHRQRIRIEGLLNAYKERSLNPVAKIRNRKLLQDNFVLMKEIDKVKEENRGLEESLRKAVKRAEEKKA